MANVAVYRVSVQKALSNAAFKAGYVDVAKANGWHERWNRLDQWNYEHGRMFATWLKTKGFDLSTFPLKNGRWVTQETIRQFKIARAEGVTW